MRWPFRREPSATDEAEDARKEARRARLDAHNFDKRVQHEMERTRQIGLRNHIAEAIEVTIIPRGRREA